MEFPQNCVPNRKYISPQSLHYWQANKPDFIQHTIYHSTLTESTLIKIFFKLLKI
jgi:hypothetical protein